MNSELFHLRTEVFKIILEIFERNPHRRYSYKYAWFDDVWDSECLIRCPQISFPFCDDTPFHRWAIHSGPATDIYVEKNVIKIEVYNYGLVDLGNVEDPEFVLECIHKAKDFKRGFQGDGYYYED